MGLEGVQLGQYRLLQLIGSGGVGEVYLAEDARINQHVAIKVNRTEGALYPEAASVQNIVRLFRREAKAIAQLDHPRILPLYGYGEETVNGTLLTYIVMPFRKEGSLAAWLRQQHNTQPLSPQEVAHIVSQAADALQYAHDHQIVHQDVKPPNFLIRSYESAANLSPDLLLTDFGIAKMSDATSTASHTTRGTAIYMAPEQWSGDPVPATDQYALAIMAYELLTGLPPFQGRLEQLMYMHISVPPQPPSTRNPRISKAIDDVLLRALAKNAQERFASISDFARAFQQAVQGDVPTFVKPPEPPKREDFNPTSYPGRFANPTPLPAQNMAPFIPVAPSPTTKSRQGFFTGKNLPLLGLVALVIFVSVGFLTLGINQINANNSHTIATTQARDATSFASKGKNQTGTSATVPIHTPTAPVTGNATATLAAENPNPYPPNSGTLALYDPLQNNNLGYNWDSFPLATYVTYGCEFDNGSYDVFQTKNNWFTDCFAQPNFSNFAYQVQMTIVNGDCGGIVFRADASQNKFYFFRICQDGTYDLRRFLDNTNNSAQTLTGSSSASIHTGAGGTNLIAVVAQGNAISLYINQQLVATVTDNAYSIGEIAVAASSKNSATDIAFNNAKVWAF